MANFLWSFPTKTLYSFLGCPVHATRLALFTALISSSQTLAETTKLLHNALAFGHFLPVGTILFSPAESQHPQQNLPRGCHNRPRSTLLPKAGRDWRGRKPEPQNTKLIPLHVLNHLTKSGRPLLLLHLPKHFLHSVIRDNRRKFGNGSDTAAT